MPYLIKPKIAGVIDAGTGLVMDTKGVLRDVLLPPDHFAERIGDVEISIQPKKTDAKPVAADKKESKQ